MCVALASFGDKIASLYESSNRFVVFHAPTYNVEDSEVSPIIDNSPNELLNLLKQHNVKILICGAISGCTRRLLNAQGIVVIPWITGDVKSVIYAFQSNRIFSPLFIMPGCRGNRGQGRHQFGKRNRNF
ncbi:NifB/NifX family molybdenum-iron cluster-binding protein [candidate division KSB1 bacterium]|nr:NifB/NifX family molybdenum-iron cluster-binding protein [candidate division KSB1 bacterium]MBL7094381.1 NifB/NifX family molybdenum-iron cluster-binding protein [candidate division KSB1 bacterium]